ncbi:flagellar protein export ATPase FliI [Catenovulum maritimum]|uniref:Flagellum-specific ATP synthase n=1 Tax=Catenovulum maritimum TaxID=1513271 RepID=A0A0J8GW42_9ALTE|nr:flagellar protein export ATPase FliI [Catenovulum maritimum]KMT64903.1 ATP synthase [Catenovulum maritimum]
MSLAQRISQYQSQIPSCRPKVAGRLTRVVGLTLEAIGCQAAIGDLCQVETSTGYIDAEVVGFEGEKIFLMPNDTISGVLPGAKVIPKLGQVDFPLSSELLGRVIDPLGKPLDGKGKLAKSDEKYKSVKINPLNRRAIKQPLDVGIKAINALLTVGMGQRIGLFAGSGVGKSVLLGMMTRGTVADVIVVGLIGERGREVKEFIDEILGEEGRTRAVVIAAPADQAPMVRLKGCETALTVAEYFRDQGLNVLLLVDSITRYAQAQREIALAVGEPPATKGYPPSVFAKLPALVERAGNGGEGQGSITAFFTVLSEGDDLQDPIADATRAILDGHIVLSRDLADQGHYPAIDISKSISRVMPAVTSPEHQQQAQIVKRLYSAYENSRDLITIGAYTKGSDPVVDSAIKLKPKMDQFLQQGMLDIIPYDDGLTNLANITASFRP